MQIKVSFGLGNSVSLNFPPGTTVGMAVKDSRVKAALGHGDSVRMLVDGVTQDANAPLREGDEIKLESIAHAKAS